MRRRQVLSWLAMLVVAIVFSPDAKSQSWLAEFDHSDWVITGLNDGDKQDLLDNTAHAEMTSNYNACNTIKTDTIGYRLSAWNKYVTCDGLMTDLDLLVGEAGGLSGEMLERYDAIFLAYSEALPWFDLNWEEPTFGWEPSEVITTNPWCSFGWSNSPEHWERTHSTIASAKAAADAEYVHDLTFFHTWTTKFEAQHDACEIIYTAKIAFTSYRNIWIGRLYDLQTLEADMEELMEDINELL